MRVLKSLLFVSVIAVSFSKGISGNTFYDSLKVKQIESDSLNPRCECLKYQKMADKEFEKLLSKHVNVSLNPSLIKASSKFVFKFKRRSDSFPKKMKHKRPTKKLSITDKCFKW